MLKSVYSVKRRRNKKPQMYLLIFEKRNSGRVNQEMRLVTFRVVVAGGDGSVRTGWKGRGQELDLPECTIMCGLTLRTVFMFHILKN